MKSEGESMSDRKENGENPATVSQRQALLQLSSAVICLLNSLRTEKPGSDVLSQVKERTDRAVGVLESGLSTEELENDVIFDHRKLSNLALYFRTCAGDLKRLADDEAKVNPGEWTVQ